MAQCRGLEGSLVHPCFIFCRNGQGVQNLNHHLYDDICHRRAWSNLLKSPVRKEMSRKILTWKRTPVPAKITVAVRKPASSRRR